MRVSIRSRCSSHQTLQAAHLETRGKLVDGDQPIEGLDQRRAPRRNALTLTTFHWVKHIMARDARAAGVPADLRHG